MEPRRSVRAATLKTYTNRLQAKPKLTPAKQAKPAEPAKAPRVEPAGQEGSAHLSSDLSDLESGDVGPMGGGPLEQTRLEEMSDALASGEYGKWKSLAQDWAGRQQAALDAFDLPTDHPIRTGEAESWHTQPQSSPAAPRAQSDTPVPTYLASSPNTPTTPENRVRPRQPTTPGGVPTTRPPAKKPRGGTPGKATGGRGRARGRCYIRVRGREGYGRSMMNEGLWRPRYSGWLPDTTMTPREEDGRPE
ncbi:hypothetical protein C8F04DRAFT_1268353 [Mycena alexandri]|uniref:Uncharacterized protein n=1 Tax=Mycena alexandri TaxID=1745969 RepID=A0AAD6SFN9_9AGAR|nr:hypothetical protein C8F04DRAFT_1268353 [Mycena alexandri]